MLWKCVALKKAALKQQCFVGTDETIIYSKLLYPTATDHQWRTQSVDYGRHHAIFLMPQYFGWLLQFFPEDYNGSSVLLYYLRILLALSWGTGWDFYWEKTDVLKTFGHRSASFYHQSNSQRFSPNYWRHSMLHSPYHKT